MWEADQPPNNNTTAQVSLEVWCRLDPSAPGPQKVGRVIITLQLDPDLTFDDLAGNVAGTVKNLPEALASMARTQTEWLWVTMPGEIQHVIDVEP